MSGGKARRAAITRQPVFGGCWGNVERFVGQVAQEVTLDPLSISLGRPRYAEFPVDGTQQMRGNVRTRGPVPLKASRNSSASVARMKRDDVESTLHVGRLEARVRVAR